MERTYALVEKNEGRTNGWQVALVLTPETERFMLVCGVYSSAWGDRHEKSTRYYGAYTEDDEKIECRVDRREELDHLDRHEEADGHENRSWQFTNEAFVFEKRGEALVCPISFEAALGKEMSVGVEPIKLF